jgi:anti-sigma factor ChrR (cupin superfamily)
MTVAAKDGCALTEHVADYALGTLAPGERVVMEPHLATCEACRDELARVRPVVDAFIAWPTDVIRPPAPLWDRLAQRVVADAGGEPLPMPEVWADEPGWRQVAPGISCKVLATDEASGSVTLLVRLAPGVAYPPHTHAGVEELHLLDGELWIEDRNLVPGDYNRAEPGTSDQRVWSETGCTCVLLTSSRDLLRS